jgi:osmotically-inducible protein OsmY
MGHPVKTSMGIALALSLSLLACAPTGTGQSTGAYIDDMSITTRVKAAILNDPDLKVAEINVETRENAVKLSGFVNSEAMVIHATTVAARVAGVKSVRNDLIELTQLGSSDASQGRSGSSY